MFHELRQGPLQSLKQIQRLMMSAEMQQAIHLMQLPVLELSTIINAELETNPVLEVIEENPSENIENEEVASEKELDFDANNFDILKRLDDEFKDHYLEGAGFTTRRSAEEEKQKVYEESLIQATPSLFQHLMVQAHETFESEEEIHIAESLIGNFDESGLLKLAIEEIALTNDLNPQIVREVLLKIQLFDPPGIGATSLQDSLLIQLRSRGLQNSLACKIIENHYEDLLHNKIPVIKKELQCTLEEIREAIDTVIIKLDLHPGATCSQNPIQTVTADITIKWENGEWIVFTNTDYMPSLRFNRKYMKMLEDESLPKETKDFIKNKIMSARWLLKTIEQRNSTIERIAHTLAKRQEIFFLEPEGKLEPLVMKTIAEELNLNESTIARAVANKYIDTPRGMFPLRFFFSHAYTTAEGDDISSKTVRDMLKKIIEGENKMQPLSDEAISILIKQKGIPCARRTVAKYRTELNIGNTVQRRQY